MNQNKINYPILKSNDNNFYLTRDYNKKHNQSGSIFMDYRNILNNVIENIKNIVKQDKPPKTIDSKICKKCSYFDLCYV